MNKTKLFTIISIFCILIMTPIAFADDGDVALANETAENVILTDNSKNVKMTDYYFDSNAPNDNGDGSASNPYKDFKSSRILENSNLHLAKGEYTLDKNAQTNNVNIIGADSSKTIIKFNYGTGFTVTSSLTLKDLTLVNLRIVNNGNLTATNTIFRDYQSSSYKGGVIDSERTNAKTVLDHCTFNNTIAKYGGAVYLDQTSLTIKNTVFDNNRANFYGGTIVATNKAVVDIKDSKFINSRSLDDAGGAIYLEGSSLFASNLEMTGCSANFGGAIAALKSNVDVTRFTARNNKAKYDGGAIYALYTGPFIYTHSTGFFITDSTFENNFAENAGAVFVYNIDTLIIKTTQFIKNRASNTAGAYYSVYLQEPYYDSILDPALHNTFSNNKAKTNNDLLEADLPETFIGSNDYLLIKGEFPDISTIPAKYDLRQLNQVTAVKDQGNDGNCWAFSTLGALESAIKKQTGIEFDLSEENMKDLMGLYSMYGWDLETNTGGYDRMGYAYLVNWLGPVNDSDDTYKRDSVLSPVLNSLVHVQNVVLLKRNNYTDNDAIKMAVMEYGGVATSLYSTHTRYQYYTGSASANHAAVIVGWDDSLEFSGAPAKGGWIVKNSWGTSFGDNGFFYVSYYDTRFAQPGKLVSYAFDLNDTIKYDKNYQYDIPGRTDYFYNSSNTVWYKNKFKATDNEYLAAVSTYFEKETDWELSIYVNNKLRLTQSGHSLSAYKTIELSQIIPLAKGDVFEVQFKIKVARQAGVPISQSIPKGDTAALNTKFYNDDMSYISYDGKKWKDLNDLEWTYSTHEYESQVACIKAFTILDKVKTSVKLQAVTDFNPFEFRAIVLNEYGHRVNSGKVTFNIDGKTFNVDVKNGIASLVYTFSTEGAKTVTAKFAAEGFYDSSASTQVNVKMLSTTLTANDVTANYNETKYLVATLKNENGNAVVGVDVKISVAGTTYTLTTDSKGQVFLSTAGIVPNKYVATISFAGNKAFKPSSTTASVTINKLNSQLYADDVTAKYNEGKSLTATLKDADGKAISGAKVRITFSGQTRTLTTDANGQVSMSIDGILPAIYEATVSFDGDAVYKQSSAKAIVTINKLNPVLTSVDVETIYNHDDKLYATLKDETGKPMANTPVNIQIGTIIKIVTTDAHGKASLSTKLFAPGKYDAIVSFTGSDIYYPVTSASKVVVYKEQSKIYLRNALYFVLQTKYVTVTLWDANNNPVVGRTVHIELNEYGLKYSGVTDENGNALIRVGVGFGVHSATVSFDGDDFYNASKKTGSIRVIKETPSVMVRGADTQFRVSENPKILKVYLRDRYNKPLLEGTKIFVKINGKTFSGTTDSLGIAHVRININYPGTFDAQVIYTGNTAYNAVTRNVKIYVK